MMCQFCDVRGRHFNEGLFQLPSSAHHTAESLKEHVWVKATAEVDHVLQFREVKAESRTVDYHKHFRCPALEILNGLGAASFGDRKNGLDLVLEEILVREACLLLPIADHQRLAWDLERTT